MNWLKRLETHTWRDVPVCILGAGPSLLHYNFSNCFNCHVFAVNSSIIKVDWSAASDPDILRVWISNDSLCKRWSYFSKVKNDICFKVVRDSWLKYKDELQDFIFFNPRKTKEDVIEENDDGLLYNSSVPSAIDLAIKLGFKNIFLFGIDHTAQGEKTHFWQYLPIKEQPKECVFDKGRKIYLSPVRIMQPVAMQKNVWNMNISVFNALKDHASKSGVSIINVNDSNTPIPFIHNNFIETSLSNYEIVHMPISKHS